MNIHKGITKNNARSLWKCKALLKNSTASQAGGTEEKLNSGECNQEETWPQMQDTCIQGTILVKGRRLGISESPKRWYFLKQLDSVIVKHTQNPVIEIFKVAVHQVHNSFLWKWPPARRGGHVCITRPCQSQWSRGCCLCTLSLSCSLSTASAGHLDWLRALVGPSGSTDTKRVFAKKSPY